MSRNKNQASSRCFSAFTVTETHGTSNCLRSFDLNSLCVFFYVIRSIVFQPPLFAEHMFVNCEFSQKKNMKGFTDCMQITLLAQDFYI